MLGDKCARMRVGQQQDLFPDRHIDRLAVNFRAEADDPLAPTRQADDARVFLYDRALCPRRLRH